MKIIIIVYLFFIINCQQSSNISNSYLNWGLKNNLSLSPYIETIVEKNKIKFIAKTDIPKKKNY